MDRSSRALTGAAAAVAGLLYAGAATGAAAPAAHWSAAGHSIDRIAAGADRLFALGGGEVLTFDGDGQPLGRCAGFAAPPRAARRDALVAPDAEEVLEAAGLPDDDSTPEAEEALEDEGLGTRRRPRPEPDGGIIPHALAANAGGSVWIATSSGIFLGDENGCRPAGLDGRDLVVVAADARAVVAATEDLLFRWSPDDAGDGDASAGPNAIFTVAGGLAERPRALAIEAGEAALVADDDGVERMEIDGPATRILDRPTDALVVCGDEALALADDGVYRWTAGAAPIRTADRPPVRAIACGPAPGARFVATGLGVWTSPDGVTWTERRETLGRSVAGAATIGDRTWLAMDDALSAVDLTAPDSRETADRPVAGSAGPIFAPLSNGQLVAPTLPWPWVTAVLGAERKADRRAWQIMVLVTFPLGRVAGRHVDPTLVSAERARRDQALAREEVDLAGDAAGDGEQTARLDSVLEEREALR